MSKKTITMCDLCGYTTETHEINIAFIAFDFGEGCRFEGDACQECMGRLRNGVRSHARYNWPQLYEFDPDPAPPAERPHVIPSNSAPAVPEIQ